MKVHLRANHDAGDGVLAAEFDNLVIDDAHHVEGLARRDGVHENEAMYTYCVLRVEEGEFVLEWNDEGERARWD